MRFDLLSPVQLHRAFVDAMGADAPNERTVRRWVKGETPMPGWARHMVAGFLGLPDASQGTEKEPPPDWGRLMGAVERIEATVLALTPAERLIVHALEESETPSPPAADAPQDEAAPPARVRYGSGQPPGQ